MDDTVEEQLQSDGRSEKWIKEMLRKETRTIPVNLCDGVHRVATSFRQRWTAKQYAGAGVGIAGVRGTNAETRIGSAGTVRRITESGRGDYRSSHQADGRQQ